MARGLGLVGLLVVALLVAWLAVRSRSKPAPAASGSASVALGDLPPDSVMQDPVAAKKHIEATSCSAGCESALQLCLGLADGESAETRCRDQRTSCEGACGQP